MLVSINSFKIPATPTRVLGDILKSTHPQTNPIKLLSCIAFPLRLKPQRLWHTLCFVFQTSILHWFYIDLEVEFDVCFHVCGMPFEIAQWKSIWGLIRAARKRELNNWGSSISETNWCNNLPSPFGVKMCTFLLHDEISHDVEPCRH